MSDKRKILVTEDEEFLSKALKSKLEESNYEVSVASDGEKCLEILKTGKFIPDIILLDLILPKKNGFDVLSEIKTMDSVKDIPVLILSNLGQDSDIEKVKEMGAVDFLVKSDTPIQDIVEKINSFVKN